MTKKVYLEISKFANEPYWKVLKTLNYMDDGIVPGTILKEDEVRILINDLNIDVIVTEKRKGK